MTEHLSIDRFRELADAYGGVIARWPEPYRRAASDLARGPAAHAILARATQLDLLMDEWRVPSPSDGLAARMAAEGSASMRHLLRKTRLWWSGIGAAAALAGAGAGMATVVIAAPAEMAVGSTTSFGDVMASGG